MSDCTCTLTDPKTWTTYGSAVEPGSQMEPDPDCPVHFQTSHAALSEIRARALEDAAQEAPETLGGAEQWAWLRELAAQIRRAD